MKIKRLIAKLDQKIDLSVEKYQVELQFCKLLTELEVIQQLQKNKRKK